MACGFFDGDMRLRWNRKGVVGWSSQPGSGRRGASTKLRAPLWMTSSGPLQPRWRFTSPAVWWLMATTTSVRRISARVRRWWRQVEKALRP